MRANHPFITAFLVFYSSITVEGLPTNQTLGSSGPEVITNFTDPITAQESSEEINIEVNNEEVIINANGCGLLLTKASRWVENEFGVSLTCAENGLYPTDNKHIAEFIEVFSNQLADYGFDYYEQHTEIDESKESYFINKAILKRFISYLENLPDGFF